MAVIEVDDRSLFRLLGLFLGQPIHDCDDPAMLLQLKSILPAPGFR